MSCRVTYWIGVIVSEEPTIAIFRDAFHERLENF
jgi:hypothetical protein